MKFKKIISNTLAIGLLLNSGLSSFAGILSEDGRYETFEGNNITIDNVLEEDEINVEIEGNTLVNLLSKQDMTNLLNVVSDTGGTGLRQTNNGFEITTALSGDGTYKMKFRFKLNSNLNGRTFTLFYDSPSEKIKTCIYNQTTSTIESEYYYTNENPKLIVLPQDDNERYLYFDIGNGVLGDNTQNTYLIDNVMLIDGNHTNKRYEYFEGMKSVGELEDTINIKATNKNIFDGEIILGSIDLTGDGSDIEDAGFNTYRSGYIRVKPNMIYSLSEERSVCFYDKNKNRISNTYSNIVTTPDNCFYMRFQQYGDKLITIAEGELSTDIMHSSQSIKIPISEPLRALPNGAKDRIIKRNGQWVVERNCGEIILNGSEGGWRVSDESYFTGNGYYTFCIQVNPTRVSDFSGVLVKSDRFNGLTYEESRTDMVGCVLFDNWGKSIGIKQTIATNLDEFKTWLQANPVKVVYVLSQPIYEPLNISPTLNTHLDITHISNNSTIPANMKVTVDRTINRATEAIELMKSNPTVANIEKARMWSNLLKESAKKDDLHNQINDITNIEDLEIEKKTISANMDLYIKSQNSLSMSLSTNSIIFENFSGVDDMEKLNAVDITVNSSLPYQLNSYLESEIKNNDGSKTIPKELLNIKLNGDNEYKAFNNINEKLVLKENCEKGSGNVFGVDLILKGSRMHEADVYKTTIKFEVEQK